MQSNVGGGWQFGFGGSGGIKDSSSSRGGGRVIRVILLGQPGVGKTAIAVRFASRRFIGEYDCSAERVYRVSPPTSSPSSHHHPHQDPLQRVTWEIADPPGNPARAPSESRLRWADAVLLVYSVTDRVSFEETWRLRFLLNQARKSSKKMAAPVVMLLGNKTDLGGPPDGDRMVSTAEGRKRAKDIEAQAFHEISARESFEQVMAVFASVARLAPLLPGARSAEEMHQLHHLLQAPGAACAGGFRLRASTDGSIDASRRRQTALQQSLSKRRLSISARGAPQ